MEFAACDAPSPLGPLRLVATRKGLAYVRLPGERPERFERWAAGRLFAATRVESLPALAAAKAQLAEYFAGERRAFDLPLDEQGTPFQQRHWAALRDVPFGATTTYDALAQRFGTSARAVGAANGANVLAIVVPCHRVVASDGALTGYAGGLGAKQKLLALERQSRLLAL